MTTGLTAESFIQAFRDRHHWKCEPGTRITNELAAFATERAGSKRDIDELYTIFCMSKSLKPYPSQPVESS